jgi:TrmH family RNA methyltransferase
MKSEHLVTSKANPLFKQIRQWVSQNGTARSYTILLGEKLIEAWGETSGTKSGRRFTPELWISLEGATAHPLARKLGLRVMLLSEPLMRDLSDSASPPRHALLGVIGEESSGSLADRVIAPWGIQDPGNLGAILRSAAAFGFQEALLGPGCADPFSPKALRGTMGSAFLMPVRRTQSVPKDDGRWFALDGSPDAIPLSSADFSGSIRILVGNEGHGWSQVELPNHVQRLRIETVNVESLNAAVAAGIACHEASRRMKG